MVLYQLTSVSVRGRMMKKSPRKMDVLMTDGDWYMWVVESLFVAAVRGERVKREL